MKDELAFCVGFDEWLYFLDIYLARGMGITKGHSDVRVSRQHRFILSSILIYFFRDVVKCFRGEGALDRKSYNSYTQEDLHTSLHLQPTSLSTNIPIFYIH